MKDSFAALRVFIADLQRIRQTTPDLVQPFYRMFGLSPVEFFSINVLAADRTWYVVIVPKPSERLLEAFGTFGANEVNRSISSWVHHWRSLSRRYDGSDEAKTGIHRRAGSVDAVPGGHEKGDCRTARGDSAAD
jgi:hypothetical protein